MLGIRDAEKEMMEDLYGDDIELFGGLDEQRAKYGDTVESALQAIIEKPDRIGSSLYKDADDIQEVAKYLLAITESEDIRKPIKYVEDGSVMYAQSDGRSVTLADKGDGDLVVIHEIVHALTSDYLHALDPYLDNPAALEKIRAKQPLADDDYLVKSQELARLWLAAVDASPDIKASMTEMNHVAYGLANVNEFVAQALSSKEMQQHLSKLQDPSATGQTLWTKFIDAVSSMFGIPVERGSILDSTITALADLKTFGDVDGVQTKVNSHAFGGGLAHKLKAERIQSPKALMSGILKRKGWTQEQIDTNQGSFEKLFDVFGVDDVELFRLKLEEVRGAGGVVDSVKRVWLGGKGLDGLSQKDQLRALSFVAGHELGHVAEGMYKNGQMSDRQHQQFDDFVKWVDEGTVADHQLAYDIGLEMLPKSMRTDEVVARALESAGKPKEVRANMLAMWAMSQTQKPDQFAMNLMPRGMRQGWRVMTDMARSVYGAMKGTGGIVQGFKKRTEMRGRVNDMVKMAEQFKEANAKAIEMESEVNKLGAIGGERRQDVLEYFDETKDVVPHDPRSKVGEYFDKVVMTFDQRAQAVPAFRGINRAMHDFNGGAKASMKRIVGSIIGGIDANGNPVFKTKEGKLDFEKVRDKPHLNKLYGDWRRLQNVYKDTDAEGNTKQGKILSYAEIESADPKLYAKLQALPEGERKSVIQMVHRMTEGMKNFQHNEVERVIDQSNIATLKYLMAAGLGDNWKNAQTVATNLYKGMRLANTPDPASQQQGTMMLRSVAEAIDPETFQRVTEVVREQHASASKLMQDFIANEHYASEMRFGKHFLHWVEPGGDPKKDTGGLAFATEKEARAYQKKLQDRGATAITYESVKRGTTRLVGEDRIMQTLAVHDERNKEFLKTLGLDPEAEAQLMSVLDYKSQFNKELAAGSIVEQGTRRGFKAGREELDMLQTDFAYFNAAVRSMHKKVFNNELQYQLTNPDLKDPMVAAQMPEVMQHVENFLAPDTELGTAITKGNAAYFLGLNLSSHMVELAQPAFSFVPELANHGVGYVRSMRMLTAAAKHVTDFTIKHLPTQAKRLRGKDYGVDDNSLWSSPEYAVLMKQAVQNDWISLGHASEVLEADLSTNVDLSRLMKDGKESDSIASKYGATPARFFANNSLKLYQQFTEFNARISLITGYELAKQKGMSGQAAIDFAGEFSRTTTFSGGKANRPTAIFSGRDSFRTGGQAAYSLQGFTFGMLSMMTRYARTAYSKKQYPDMPESARQNARKALKTMVATQFLGAGIVGMPFAQAINELFEKTTGIELERTAREGLASLFNEDEKEDGGMLSDVVMHGAANAILGKVLPGAPEVGSRFSIGGILGVNAYDGFSMSSLAGPTGSVIENVAKGATSLLKDRSAGQAFEDVMPIAFKKLIDLSRNGGEFRDKSGGLLIDGTMGEKAMYGMGFTPQRVRKMKNYERLNRKHEQHVRDKDVKTYDELSDLFTTDPVAVQQELLKIAKADPKVRMLQERGMNAAAAKALESSMKSGAGKIAERIERKTHARDPRRAGSFNATSGSDSLINALGQSGKVSEVDRLNTRNSVLASLGMAPSTSPRVSQRAMMIDQIMAQNPMMPRPQAATLADSYLAGNQSSQQPGRGLNPFNRIDFHLISIHKVF